MVKFEKHAKWFEHFKTPKPEAQRRTYITITGVAPKKKGSLCTQKSFVEISMNTVSITRIFRNRRSGSSQRLVCYLMARTRETLILSRFTRNYRKLGIKGFS